MSADHFQFLKNKFIQDLEEAEEEHTGENEIPLLSHFLRIRGVLKEKKITAWTPICLKNCLYDAMSALEECVVLSEKREPRKKKDGPMRGYTLAEHWFMHKTRRMLLRIQRKLEGIAEMGATTASSSIERPFILNRYDEIAYSNFEEQKTKILDGLQNRGKGFQEIVILGIGGSGKTTLARVVSCRQPPWQFPRSYKLWDINIWIDLLEKLSSGDVVELKEIIKNMLKQCNEAATLVDDEDLSEDELLEILGNALKGKKYLIVFDDIWDINIDWYLKLKQKLKSVSSVDGHGYGHVIITTRLPHKARMMVGPRNLYHIQPLPSSSMEGTWERSYDMSFDMLNIYRPKMKVEIVERCDGLPLALNTLAEAIDQRMLNPG